MSDFNRQMAKMMSGTKTKVICGEVMGNIDPLTEWIKWLSYTPDFQKKRINELQNKKVIELSLSELDELRENLYQKRMLDLIKIYGTEQISKDEYMEVYDYIKNESIDRIMLSKLTKEELDYVKENISKYSSLSREELNLKINKEQEKSTYNSLSMVDSYILHIISRISFSRSIGKLNDEIASRIEENNAMRQKNYYYASNPYRR